MSKEISEEALKSLKAKVFVCARDGMAISIFAMLWNLDKKIIHDVLNHATEENEQITTPLVIAARNGAYKVVSILLSNFKVDIEQTGTVKFDGFVIHKASALWCAAGAGHIGIVKLLVQNGADVNHPTQTNSTPLRAACFDGRLDIVKYLIENKADFSIPNKYRNTCLMIASFKGHIDVVRFLLEKGGNPDFIAHCGATALHFAAECGHIEIVRELIKFHAKQIKNNHKMTPLMVAAESGKAEVVEIMVALPECTKEDKIDALELLGAFYANDKTDYDVDKAMHYLEEAMHVRYSDPNNILVKKLCPPIPAYENVKECQTLEELQKIKGNSNALHMQSLTVRERILGPDNPEVPHALVFRGAVYADNSSFQRCIDLWFHALHLRQTNKVSVTKDLLRFAQVFSQMIHVGAELNIMTVVRVFEKAVLELSYDMKRICSEEENENALREIYQINIHTCLYLLVIAQKSSQVQNETHIQKLKRLVYKFIKMNPRLENGYSPLHMAVDFATLVDDFHVEEVVEFPNAPLTELLLQCGANVNVLDNQKNTPMHIIAKLNSPFANFEVFQKILESLVNFGAHLDMRNNERLTPLQSCETMFTKVIIRSHTQISLKCIAASCIQKHGILLGQDVPDFVREFVAAH